MKVNLSTMLRTMGLVAAVVTAVALIRFYPDLRRYVQMKSM